MNSSAKATQCVHAGTQVDPVTKGLVTPVYPSTAYDFIDVPNKVYPRNNNAPNQLAVSRKLARLENAEDAMVFSSGMAAISTVMLAFLEAGDHIVLQNDLYGGTHHAITQQLSRYGISFDLVDSSEVDNFAQCLRPNTRLIYIESPSNPLLKIIDIEAIASLGRTRQILTVIDNTFASPVNQNPIDLGINIVLHSGTKYLAGHSDLCCGAVISSAHLIEKLTTASNSFGGSLNAFDCALLERSLKTLVLRVNQQNENAMAVAEFLSRQPQVERVNYPGLKNHPGHELAARQMSGFGGMLSFELKTGKGDFIQRLQLISPAMSLGGVESTITSPCQTSHAKLTASERRNAGISDSLWRLSVGVEFIDDLIADLEQALY